MTTPNKHETKMDTIRIEHDTNGANTHQRDMDTTAAQQPSGQRPCSGRAVAVPPPCSRQTAAMRRAAGGQQPAARSQWLEVRD